MASRSGSALGGRACLAAALVTAMLLTVVFPIDLSAQQWPVLKQGMWEFTRTMQAPGGAGGTKTVTSKQCTNPADDLQRQSAKLSASGCTISPIRRIGNTYTFSSACKIMGISSNTTTTIVVESDSAYTLTVEGTTDGERTQEVMKARRTGDCSR